MSALTIYSDAAATQILLQSDDFETIKYKLGTAGICFTRWYSDTSIAADADNDSILTAYKTEIDKLVAEQGYQSYDVVSMSPDHPQKAEFRNKFLAEHCHSEDEVRFFVRGQGLFALHIEDKVYALLCEKDDLISVPANTRHWFDMGSNPVFTAIRLFNNPDGWVAHFTGNDIASRFPGLDN